MKDWKLTADGFKLNHPYEYRSWFNYLGNKEYGIRIGHLGDAFSTTLKEPRRVITNYDFFYPVKGRYLYIKDGASLWNPSFMPVKAELDSYECQHAPGFTRFNSEKSGIKAETTHFLPIKGCFEIWKTRIENTSGETKKISVYPEVEYLLYDSFGIDPIYYSWFTNSRFEEDKKTLAFFKTDSTDVYGFFHALNEPVAYEASLNAFRGSGDMQSPKGLLADKLSSQPSAGDPYIGCFQYDLELAPGEVWETAYFVGEGKDVYDDIKARFSSIGDVDAEFEANKKLWAEKLHRAEFEKVEDDVLRNYLQTFMPYQIFQQSEGLVRSTYRGYRDVAQDAMGMSYFDLESSRELISSLLDKQFDNGRCLRQWNTSGGFNDERDFRDLPFWLPLAVSKYIENGGSKDILDQKANWFKSEESASVYEHIVRGIKYALQFGPNDLVQMGIGDWNDALSGLGTEGESVWLNQIAYLALEKIKEFNDQYGFSCDLDIQALQDRLYDGVVRTYTGKWFARGVDQHGKLLGGEDRIFLLPQAWFTISGMSKRDPEKAETALNSMMEKCNHDSGILICYPGFEEYDPNIGNLSALAPGMAENYAIYNHASAFGVYALLQAGKNDEAVDAIRKLLPIYKDPNVTRSEPFVIVNYYNGGYYESKSGQGGIPWLTSTVSWFAMALFDIMIPKGVQL